MAGAVMNSKMRTNYLDGCHSMGLGPALKQAAWAIQEETKSVDVNGAWKLRPERKRPTP